MPRIVFFFLLLLSGLILESEASAHKFHRIIPAEKDTIFSEPIIFTSSSAAEYINQLLKQENLWRPSGENLKMSLERLIDHFDEPIDSVRTRLHKWDQGAVEFHITYLSQNDTLPLRWLNGSTFIVDTIPLEKEPFIFRKTYVMNVIDSSAFSFVYTKPDLKLLLDSMMLVRDTIHEVFIDTLFLESKKIRMHQIVDQQIIPPLMPAGIRKSVRFLLDSSNIIVSETSRAVIANKESPFYIVPSERMPDSLQYALKKLLTHTETRDSILVFFNNLDGQKTPFWLSNREGELDRLWVKNQANDSITIWIGNPSKYDLSLVLEDNVSVERREKKMAEGISLSVLQPQRVLAILKPITEIPVYWDYGFESAFTLNQTYFSTWAKGGENSLSTMLDVKAIAQYKNNAVKSHWTSSGRMRYGSIATKAHGFRTNTDMLEFNSQYNKVIKGKVDFSSVLYFKTQVAKGYKYPNDSVVVSRFLNPGTFTIGVGFEYKPFDKTRINLSPLSYRNTFVLDTANINQKAHGIELDRRSRQEMGGQLVIVNSTTILEGLNISNAIRLFSGYLEKPKNVDVDWEISLDKQISWFFLIRLNLHLIYDDDILFAIQDSEGAPVLMPDGSAKKVPQTQFKQFLGLTLSFKI